MTMRVLSRGRLIAILLAAVMLAIPALSVAQTTGSADWQAGYDDGVAAGTAGSVWYLAGCLGVVGLLIAYVVEPTVPTEALVGKSQEYTDGYMQGYKTQAKKEQFNKALIGCVAGTVVQVALWAALVAASDTD